jgi:hypothetical protein
VLTLAGKTLFRGGGGVAPGVAIEDACYSWETDEECMIRIEMLKRSRSME